jgi:hypothetical protein
MTTEAANLDLVATVATLAVGHLHAIVWSAPEARNGMPPNVTAVTADAVLFVNSCLIGIAVVSVAIRAGQARAASVNRVGEKDVCGLLGIDQPRRLF